MKNKGFTLIELLVVIVIIGLISSIGVFGFGNILGVAETNYYESIENDLLLSANDYFQDHRDELPLSDYREVFISDLVNGRYIEQVKDKNGNNCTGSIFIWRDEKGKYQYEVCLKCGNYVSGGRYCRGEGLNSIDVSAKTEKSNQNYNVLLRNPGIVNNENIIVTFEATNLGEKKVTKYVYVNTNNNHEGTCTSITNNKCTNVKITESGTYKVNAYDKDNKKIAQERYFYVFIDRNGLDFDIVGENKYIIVDESNTKKIEFKIQNITQNIKKIEYRLDDGTYKEANGYSIIMDVNSKKGHILEVKITNLANEVVTKTFQFDVSYLINLDYKDGNVDFFEVIKDESYGYLSELPSQYNGRTAKWLYNNLEVTNDTIVTLDKRHTLELRNYEIVDKNTLTSNCIEGLIYNGTDQILTKENEYMTFTNNIGKDAEIYAITAKLKDGVMWSTGNRNDETFNCEIAKRSVSVIASDQNKDYDGIALTADNTCTISNGLTGDIVECSNNTGSQTNAGTSAKVVGTVLIKNNGVDVTRNYNVSKTQGNLTVNKVAAEITCQNKNYNGSAQAIATCSGGTLDNESYTDAGGYTITCTGDINHSDASATCNINKVPSVITCQNRTYNGSVQTIATCIGGTVENANQTYYRDGGYSVTCRGDKNHTDATPTDCNIDVVTRSITFHRNNASKIGGEDVEIKVLSCTEGIESSPNCTIISPTIEGSSNTPTVIGWGLATDSHISNWNVGESKAISSDGHYYAQSMKEKVVRNISYTAGSGVSSIGKNSDSCENAAVYNGSIQATSCNVTLPTITEITGYTSSKWYKDNVEAGSAGGTYVLSSDTTLTAKATSIISVKLSIDGQTATAKATGGSGKYSYAWDYKIKINGSDAWKHSSKTTSSVKRAAIYGSDKIAAVHLKVIATDKNNSNYKAATCVKFWFGGWYSNSRAMCSSGAVGRSDSEKCNRDYYISGCSSGGGNRCGGTPSCTEKCCQETDRPVYHELYDCDV